MSSARSDGMIPQNVLLFVPVSYHSEGHTMTFLQNHILISLFIFKVTSIVQATAPSSRAFVTGPVLAAIDGLGVHEGSLPIYIEET